MLFRTIAMNVALHWAVAFPVVLAARAWRPEARRLTSFALLLLGLDLALRLSPQPAFSRPPHWPWFAQALPLVLVLAAATALGALRAIGVGRSGFSGNGRVILVTLALGAFAAAVSVLAGERLPVTAEAFLFEATMPGLSEELVYRGAALALLDRALPPEWSVAGARLGWGAVLTAVVFVSVHTFFVAPNGTIGIAVEHGFELVEVVAIGVLAAYLRARTDSVLPAILLHNATNLTIFAASAVARVLASA